LKRQYKLSYVLLFDNVQNQKEGCEAIVAIYPIVMRFSYTCLESHEVIKQSLKPLLRLNEPELSTMIQLSA